MELDAIYGVIYLISVVSALVVLGGGPSPK
jgi:hypothetical protein